MEELQRRVDSLERGAEWSTADWTVVLGGPDRAAPQQAGRRPRPDRLDQDLLSVKLWLLRRNLNL